MPSAEHMTTQPGPYFEEVGEGMSLPELRACPSTVQLFYWSAVGWLAHRIHYDQAYARSEGHPDVLVHGGLQGALLAQVVTTWMGATGRLVRLAWQNRARVVAGTPLTLGGQVTRRYVEAGVGFVEVELWERDEGGRTCALGTATVLLPHRPDAEQELLER